MQPLKQNELIRRIFLSSSFLGIKIFTHFFTKKMRITLFILNHRYVPFQLHHLAIMASHHFPDYPIPSLYASYQLKGLRKYVLFQLRNGTRSIASTSKIKSRLTAALVINSFESRPADLVTTVTDHPERTGRYHPYVSESLLRDIRSNHTVLGCLPLLFPQCCR